MFKLKDILIEDQENSDPYQAAEQFIEYMNSGDWIIPQKRGIGLYRGTKREVLVGVKEKYDEVRDPMNTDASLQDVIDTITTIQYPERPRRSYSRFGSTIRKATKSYGTPHYVFPRKGSKLVSYEEDVFVEYFAVLKVSTLYEYFERLSVWVGEGDEDYKKDLYNFLRSYFDQDVVGIIQAYYETKNGNYRPLRVLCRKLDLEDQLSIMTMAKEKAYISEAKDFGFDEKKGYDMLNSFMAQYMYFLHDILEFFQDGEKGIVEGSYEVAMEGDVLHVRADFVDEYLTFDEQKNSWRVDLPK